MRGVDASGHGVAGLAGRPAARRLLALSIVAAVLAAPAAGLAQEGSANNAGSASITLPEIHVIGSTPLPPVRRPEKHAAALRRSGEQQSRAPTTRPPATAAPALATQSGAPVEPGAVERDKIPANVQTLAAPDFAPDLAPTFLDALARGVPGLALSDQTGNEFQRNIDYRGFLASPVVGTPQGLAVYQNGVRINEVFGDTVNWDFIPRDAINQLTLVPSNPVYGLNAIGGALALEMKNGLPITARRPR